MNEITKTSPGAMTSWELAASENVGGYLNGSLLKFNKGKFYAGREERPIPEGALFAVADLKMVWVKWQGGRPVAFRENLPAAKPVTRDMLGDEEESEWELDEEGKRKDPWVYTYYLYLIDPKSAEAFTFTTSSAYGVKSVRELSGQIATIQTARPGALPIIAAMAGEERHPKYGRVPKPRFVVTEWRGGAAALERRRETMTIVSSKRPDDPIDDDEPF